MDVKRELTKQWKWKDKTLQFRQTTDARCYRNGNDMTVWLTDEKEEALRLYHAGECVVFVLTPDNRDVFVPEIGYCVEVEASGSREAGKAADGLTEDAQWADWLNQVDADYLEKVWQRHTGKPWHILDTDRLTLREMCADDLDSLYEIADDADSRIFMEPLEKDREAERIKMQEYVQYMYGFYGFGIWMVELRSDAQQPGQGSQADSVRQSRDVSLAGPDCS